MCRIGLNDNMLDILTKMSDGNPGAISAMMGIIEKHDVIDPQAMLGGVGAIMLLDTWKIYGSDIYILCKDKCGGDLRRVLMLMRATQLGLFSQGKLQQMAADQTRSVNLTKEEFLDLDQKVCGQLDDFAKIS